MSSNGLVSLLILNGGASTTLRSLERDEEDFNRSYGTGGYEKLLRSSRISAHTDGSRDLVERAPRTDDKVDWEYDVSYRKRHFPPWQHWKLELQERSPERLTLLIFALIGLALAGGHYGGSGGYSSGHSGYGGGYGKGQGGSGYGGGHGGYGAGYTMPHGGHYGGGLGKGHGGYQPSYGHGGHGGGKNYGGGGYGGGHHGGYGHGHY
ncbi:eggshell protein-like [Dermacentor silvarum]|uniref:eggshell protein-like n=1 Tax=Dermacentor silvarum TaxID=543639 RepID=UPI00189A8AFB|nr:eggshell protein-like [Dermacentor silvarum]